MFEALVYGTVWFWIFVTFVGIVFTSYIFTENGTSATWVFIISGLVYFFGGGKEVILSLLDMILSNPGKILGYTAAYLGLGLIYSFWKWTRFCIEKRDRDIKYAQKYNTDKSIQRLYAKDHKGDIIRWVSYWPLSFILTLLDDPLRKLINRIVSMFDGVYDKLSESVYRDVVTKTKPKVGSSE